MMSIHMVTDLEAFQQLSWQHPGCGIGGISGKDIMNRTTAPSFSERHVNNAKKMQKLVKKNSITRDYVEQCSSVFTKFIHLSGIC